MAIFQPTAKKFQYGAMPAAAEFTGRIVQYVGATVSGSYTNGYFYISNGTTWTQVNVQPGGGDGLWEVDNYALVPKSSLGVSTIRGITTLDAGAGGQAQIIGCGGVFITADDDSSIEMTGSELTFNGEIVTSRWKIQQDAGSSIISLAPNQSCVNTLDCTGMTVASTGSNLNIKQKYRDGNPDYDSAILMSSQGTGAEMTSTVDIRATYIYFNGQPIEVVGGSKWDACAATNEIWPQSAYWHILKGISNLNGVTNINECGYNQNLYLYGKDLYFNGALIASGSGGAHGIPTGGTCGQVLTKLSSTNYDVGWRTPAPGGGGTGDPWVLYASVVASADTACSTAVKYVFDHVLIPLVKNSATDTWCIKNESSGIPVGRICGVINNASVASVSIVDMSYAWSSCAENNPFHSKADWTDPETAKGLLQVSVGSKVKGNAYFLSSVAYLADNMSVI